LSKRGCERCFVVVFFFDSYIIVPHPDVEFSKQHFSMELFDKVCY
jgi:hypothetical protein